MELTSVDLVIIFLYLMAVLAIGLVLSGKNDHPDKFMLAKRSLPGWLIGFSIFASMVSNITVLGSTGKVFAEDLAPLAMDLSLPLAIIITCIFFIPFHRKQGHASAYTHLEGRFGPWAMLYGVITYILAQMIRMASILYLISLALASILDVNVFTLIIITGIVVIAYTYMGGIEAVIWTDFLQGVILLGGVILSILYVVSVLPGGITQVFEIAQAHDKLTLGEASFDFDLTRSSFWTMFVLGFSLYLMNYGINQTYVQRYMAAKSDKEAKRGLAATIWTLWPIITLVSLLGLSLFAFYTVYPSEGVFDMKADQIFPHFIATELPVGLRGLLIAAILASAMSSIDSSLNGIATLVHSNIYLRFINPHPGQKKAMRLLHRISLIGGGLAIAIALTMTQMKSVWDTWYKVSTTLGGAIFGLFLLGLMFKRPDSRSGLIAVLCGLGSTAWLMLSEANPLSPFLTGTVSTLVILCVGCAASFIGRLRA